MAEEKKETIVIPRVAKFFRRKKEDLKKNPHVLILVLIFILFLVLLVLITYLPISLALKILGLLIGSFILEDVHHSFKKSWTKQSLN